MRLLLICAMLTGISTMPARSAEQPETLADIGARLSRESSEAYDACPYAFLSKDYFARFTRDPAAKPENGETLITTDWNITMPPESAAMTGLMASHLAKFLDQAMDVNLDIATQPLDDDTPAIVLRDNGGGAPDVPESFTITVAPNRITIAGLDPAGLRDGVVHLVGQIGFRQAPILKHGATTYTPRIPVRLGTVPWKATLRDLVFMGYNTTWASGGSLHALSVSDAIPELAVRRNPGALDALAKSVKNAQQYGLKTYCFLNTRQKFPKDDPIFAAHPEIRGALTWKADGEYVLCTEHPLVQQYYTESIRAIYEAAPGLTGLIVIIGGEGFYHCYMRPYGVPKGRTNCARCDALGAETVVANLCNRMAAAARSVNPQAEVIAWPYSAVHVWSADATQEALIAKLNPGTGIFTEMEKDEYVAKPDGVNKHLWDYSIDLIGPGPRAQAQIAACRARGLSIYLKSEPEIGFEAPRLPHIPCLDRWWDRAEALATCGGSGAWVFPAFRPVYGTSAAELPQYAWWTPVGGPAPDKETILGQLAARIAGRQAAPHLRKAWGYVSEAIPWSPELPPYYTGPYYLGPAHPMCADPDAKLPDVFYGLYLFYAEITDADGLKRTPTFMTNARGDVPVFGAYYRKMEAFLKQADDEIDQAAPLVPKRHRPTFDAEASPTRWFYRTARTHANFYESCQLRDAILAKLRPADGSAPTLTPDDTAQLRTQLTRWREVLRDELDNTTQALPLIQADMRLDCYYGGDHTFSHAADMIQAKLKILQQELDQFLPSLKQELDNP